MPLTAKGEEIKAAMQEQYGAEKGEEVFYASKNAGTISGVDEATWESPLSNTDQMLDPLLPEPTLEHPQQHPDASTPPEPAYTGPPADELRAAYGGLTGGCNPQGTFGSDWDCTVDGGRAFDQATVVEAPPGMPVGEILLQNAGYWFEHGVAPGPEDLVPTHAVDRKGD
jgi:hypothetical protein